MGDRRPKAKPDYLEGGIQIEAEWVDGSNFKISPVLGPEVDATREPTYTAGEVSRLFFGRNGNWLRWEERRLETSFAQRAENGYRRYALSNIEEMAFFLADHRRIEAPRLASCLFVIKIQAIMYEYLCWHGNPPAKCLSCKIEHDAKTEIYSQRAPKQQRRK